MTNRIVITIVDQTKRARRTSWLISGLVPFVFMGVGTVLGNTAMEWFGFIVTILFIAGSAVRMASKGSELTIEQARKLLDEIEGDNT